MAGNDVLRIARSCVPALFAGPGGRADHYAAAAEIDQLAAVHEVVAAALAESHRVAADVPHGTAVENDVPRTACRHGRAEVHFRLREALTLRRRASNCRGRMSGRERRRGEANAAQPRRLRVQAAAADAGR